MLMSAELAEGGIAAGGNGADGNSEQPVSSLECRAWSPPDNMSGPAWWPLVSRDGVIELPKGRDMPSVPVLHGGMRTGGDHVLNKPRPCSSDATAPRGREVSERLVAARLGLECLAGSRAGAAPHEMMRGHLAERPQN